MLASKSLERRKERKKDVMRGREERHYAPLGTVSLAAFRGHFSFYYCRIYIIYIRRIRKIKYIVDIRLRKIYIFF